MCQIFLFTGCSLCCHQHDMNHISSNVERIELKMIIDIPVYPPIAEFEMHYRLVSVDSGGGVINITPIGDRHYL
jgi:hypothetical protein